jgi:hypothetical protein
MRVKRGYQIIRRYWLSGYILLSTDTAVSGDYMRIRVFRISATELQITYYGGNV